jgi:uncharacterized protein (TIGR03000 family)
MYTVVLMSALTTGTAVPNWHWYNRGCYGVYANTCIGCYGGYHGWNGYGPGGDGSLGMYSYRCYCNYGVWNAFPTYTGDSPYAGGFGPLHPQFSSYGIGSSYHYGYGGYAMMSGHGIMSPIQCHGCYGCYAGWSCYGYSDNYGYSAPVVGAVAPDAAPPAPVVPPVKTDPPGPGASKDKSPEAKNLARAQVVVNVPEGATLYIDGQRMKDAAGRRVFQTPLLSSEQTYFYDVRLEVTQNGKTVSEERRIVLRPGMEVAAFFPKLEIATTGQAKK